VVRFLWLDTKKRSRRSPPMRTETQDYLKSPYFPDEMNLWLLEGSYHVCGAPMHIKSGDDIAFCWECACDEMTAREGRELLSRAKAKYADTCTEQKTATMEDMRGIFGSGNPL